jgi:hypothetical protein
LILVTGFDVTSSWGIASFSDVSSNMEVELSFSPSHHGMYSWETNVSATVRTSPGSEPIPALRENSGGLSIWNQPAVEGVRDLIMAPASRTVDASRGTFNEVRGNQTYHITNNITLGAVDDSCKLLIHISMDTTNHSNDCSSKHHSRYIRNWSRQRAAAPAEHLHSRDNFYRAYSGKLLTFIMLCSACL